MGFDSAAATAVFSFPNERLVLDFYDGPVQAVYLHDVYGAWYIFATGTGPREREFCMRPIQDASVVEAVANMETVDEANWLIRLGTEQLLPACGPQGFRVRLIDNAVHEVRALTHEELLTARPRSVSDLFG